MHATHVETAGDSETTLTMHIRHLLLNYVVRHITTDYIQLTEQAVLDLRGQYFTEIPTTDPNSLILPADPFETFVRLHALDSREPFREIFQSTPGAIQHIKTLIKPQAGNPKSTRVALQETIFESYVSVCRPISPILTTRAMRETPRQNTRPTQLLDSLPASHPDFLSSQGITPIEIEAVSETLVKQDDVLNTNWRLRPGNHESVRSLLRSVLTYPTGYKNRHLDFYSRPDSPPMPSRIPEPPFIPVFARRRRAGSGVREGDPAPSGLKGIASLPAVIMPPVKVEQLEPDLHEQNMVIVDGWHAYKSSPSPTPSLGSSQEEQIDELFMSTPNTTPPPVRPTKMDIVQIPRVKRIGGERKKPLPLGYGSDLSTFLAPLVQKTPAAIPPTPLSPEPTSSMVGQPDSACASTARIDREGLDAELSGLYGPHKQDPRDLILKEKLDGKRQLLMDLPDLPPPNQHPPNALFLPSSLGEFVMPLKAKGQGNVRHPGHQFLKKAKGIPSLNVELSWVPITAKTRIPTSSEIIKVTGLFDTDALPPDLSTQIAVFLGTVPAPSASELPALTETWCRRYLSDVHPEVEVSDPEIVRCEIVLSRKERRRMAGLPDEVQDAMDVENSYEPADTEDAPVEDRYTKRPRLSRDEYFDDSGIAFDPPVLLPPDDPAFYCDADYTYDDDKENLPPSHDDYDEFAELPAMEYDVQFDPNNRTSALTTYSRTSQDGLDIGPVYEPGEFMALSFESLPPISAQPTQLPPDDPCSDGTYSRMFEPYPDAILNDSEIPDPFSLPANAPEIATRSLGIAEFAKLRAKKVTVPIPESIPTSPRNDTNPQFEEPSRIIPESIYDQNTLRLPSTWNPPDSLHRYMVSMELVQKQGLVRCLRSRACSIDLVERDSLGGVDIVLDPHTAIIFTNLLVLPSECADLTHRIGQQSWLYSRLLVVFDAYPASHSYQFKGNHNMASELFAYSPPVLKALGKLRRDVGISEGCGTKRQACAVQYAFADTVDEAARFTRCFGDFAQANDESRGVIWGDRAWLDDDVPEGEEDLAAASGMNRFAAFLILCQIDLGEFLELSPEVRVEKFSAFVGVERMILLNEVIERRLQAMQPSDSEMGMGLL
ncbi:hypothetical protein C8R47DRAFT_1125852 [Mycena vitilis]|nr:hypothetical protein C8R47DRAFT_1125852 [Mycena vitilis]